MKGLALVLDALGLALMLTVVGEVATEAIGFVGDAAFLLWFWMKGANFMGRNSGKKLQTLLINSVAESIPFLNGVYPGFSIETWRLTALMREEDEHDANRKIASDPRAEAIRAQTDRRAAQSEALAAAEERYTAANDNDTELEQAA